MGVQNFFNEEAVRMDGRRDRSIIVSFNVGAIYILVSWTVGT
jgi:hypothetical protein